MNARMTIRRFFAPILTTFLLGTLTAQPAHAQSDVPREHVLLPPATAGTPLSLRIAAEASYLAARGDMEESIARARKIHAEAFAKEIENSKEYVDAYFKRRELNREWRAKENPDYLARQERLREMRKQRMEKHFQEVLDGNLADELNWLLTELSGPSRSLLYADEDDVKLNRNISKEEMEHVRFSDGRASFSAVDPEVLVPQWPWALRNPEYDVLRKDFDGARKQVLLDIKSEGQAGFESGERLIKSVDALLTALKTDYPPDKYRDGSDSSCYLTAKRYLTTLALESHRVIHGAQDSLGSETLAFDGGTIIALIRHMDQTGLVFASPTPGDERVYRSLLTSMRRFYLEFGN